MPGQEQSALGSPSFASPGGPMPRPPAVRESFLASAALKR